MIQGKRLDPIVSLLITNHYCTLHELKEVYNIYDLLDMYETCVVHAVNKNRAMEVAMRNGGQS